MAMSKPPEKPTGTPTPSPQQKPAPHSAAADKDHPVFPDYASI